MSTTVSDLIFVHGLGWLFTVSTALLGIASVALTVTLARTRLPGGSLIIVVLGLWSLGLIVAAAFPTDPIGAEHLSVVGQIHRYAGATMHVALPVAGWLVFLRSQAYAAGPPQLAVASATVVDPIVAVLLGVVLLGEASGIPWWVGVGEMVAGAVAIAGVIGLSAIQIGPPVERGDDAALDPGDPRLEVDRTFVRA